MIFQDFKGLHLILNASNQQCNINQCNDYFIKTVSSEDGLFLIWALSQFVWNSIACFDLETQLIDIQ